MMRRQKKNDYMGWLSIVAVPIVAAAFLIPFIPLPPLSLITQQVNRSRGETAQPDRPQPIASSRPVAEPVAVLASPIPLPVPSGVPSITIKSCGNKPAHANFYSEPGRNLLGAVRQGQQVYLIGPVVTDQNGDRWYPAFAIEALIRVADKQAQNRLEPGQTGWIASCFVE